MGDLKIVRRECRARFAIKMHLRRLQEREDLEEILHKNTIVAKLNPTKKAEAEKICQDTLEVLRRKYP
jgi:hypothetical protein